MWTVDLKSKPSVALIGGTHTFCCEESYLHPLPLKNNMELKITQLKWKIIFQPPGTCKYHSSYISSARMFSLFGGFNCIGIRRSLEHPSQPRKSIETPTGWKREIVIWKQDSNYIIINYKDTCWTFQKNKIILIHLSLCKAGGALKNPSGFQWMKTIESFWNHQLTKHGTHQYHQFSTRLKWLKEPFLLTGSLRCPRCACASCVSLMSVSRVLPVSRGQHKAPTSAFPKTRTTRNSLSIHGDFLKWWYPTTIGVPTKNDHFRVFWGYHHLRKHPHELHMRNLQEQNTTWFWINIKHHEMPKTWMIGKVIPTKIWASRAMVFYKSLVFSKQPPIYIYIYIYIHHHHPQKALSFAPSFDNPPLLASNELAIKNGKRCHFV